MQLSSPWTAQNHSSEGTRWEGLDLGLDTGKEMPLYTFQERAPFCNTYLGVDLMEKLSAELGFILACCHPEILLFVLEMIKAMND